MSPLEIRNSMLAAKMIKNLERRNMTAYYCPTAREAAAKVNELLADGESVTWGGSVTLSDTGIIKALYDRGTLNIIDRATAQTAEEKLEMYRKAFCVDVYLTSANAISEDGVIVNIDGNGNRVAAITFGPKRVIFVISLSKVCATPEAALARARSTAAPINSARFPLKTPCKSDGTCHNCNSADSICNFIHFLRNSPQRRHTVILLGEDYGY